MARIDAVQRCKQLECVAVLRRNPCMHQPQQLCFMGLKLRMSVCPA
jgi:hypothetical protein